MNKDNEIEDKDLDWPDPDLCTFGDSNKCQIKIKDKDKED